jgi:hypothetical protein
MNACSQRFPQPRKGQQAAWAACANEAERPLGAFQPYPDLLELKFANRLALSAKMDRGQITYEDAQLESAKLNSQVMAEFERRTNAKRAVNAQEIAADAAYRNSLGVTCTRFGDIVTCN